jgi:hypothetical protein
MTEIKIEKNVPLPAPKHKTSAFIQTLRDMDVGDSFVYPKAKRANLGGYFCRFPDRKFCSRSIDETQIRIWRLE